MDVEWPLGTDGSGIAEELSAADDANKQESFDSVFQTSQEGQMNAPTWEVTWAFSMLVSMAIISNWMLTGCSPSTCPTLTLFGAKYDHTYLVHP